MKIHSSSLYYALLFERNRKSISQLSYVYESHNKLKEMLTVAFLSLFLSLSLSLSHFYKLRVRLHYEILSLKKYDIKV